MNAFGLAAGGIALAAAFAATSPAMGGDIIGTPGDDTLRGTSGGDWIEGRSCRG